jgi:DNA-binding transcriptional MerR regulator
MSKTKENSKFMTTQEVSDLLGVSDQTIRNWESAGILKSFKGGLRSKFYSRSTITKLMDDFDNLAQCETMLESRIKETRQMLDDYNDFIRDLTNRQPHQVRRFASVLNKIVYHFLSLNEKQFTNSDKDILNSILAFKPTIEIAQEHNCCTQRIRQIYDTLEERIEKTDSLHKMYEQLVSETNRLRKENEELLVRLAQRDDPEPEHTDIDILKLPISKFNFSNRLLNILGKHNIKFMYQLVNSDPRKLWITRNFGVKCAKEIETEFNKYSLSFVNFPKGLEDRYSKEDFYNEDLRKEIDYALSV